MKWGIFLLVLLFSGCTAPYQEHFWGERNRENVASVWSGDFLGDGTLFRMPDAKMEDFLVKKIAAAKKRIFLEIYTFTKREKILQALVDAKKRGVEVRIILEGNVYGSPYINVNTKKFLEKNSIPTRYANNERFVFTHAKFWLIDEEYFVSTGNFTASFFEKNREYIFSGNDQTTSQFLQMIFHKDYEYKGFSQKSEIPDHIVISPLNSREKIEDFIQKTQKKIVIYVQTVSDKSILRLLDALQKAGKEVKLCTAKNEGNLSASEFWEHDWYFAEKPYLHAKIMVRDEEVFFIWSQNFTKNSLENNREVGILVAGRIDLIKNLMSDIKEHCGW